MKNKRQITRYVRRIAALLLVVLMGGSMLLGLSGCKQRVTHYVDYDGKKFAYRGARDAYRVGEKVTLYFNLIATDTEYTFYLDGEALTPEYDEKDGFKIQFTMPDRDVKLSCDAKNTMTADTTEVPESTTEPQTLKDEGVAVLRYDILTGSEDDGGRYTLTLSRYPDDKLILDVYAIQLPNGKEVFVRYVVPDEALTECLLLIEERGVKQWNSSPAAGTIEGKVITLEYLDGDKMVRVSSERMPADGEQTLQAIRETLNKYIPKG